MSQDDRDTICECYTILFIYSKSKECILQVTVDELTN